MESWLARVLVTAFVASVAMMNAHVATSIAAPGSEAVTAYGYERAAIGLDAAAEGDEEREGGTPEATLPELALGAGLLAASWMLCARYWMRAQRVPRRARARAAVS